MFRSYVFLAAVAAAFLSAPFPALADKRIALVVGNSNYQNVARLENPRNDATLMATTLRSLGFTLVGDGPQLDLDKAALDLTVQKFGSTLQGADVAMFYYAGHGVQIRGANFLVPVGANPTREADVDFQMVDVGLVLRQMEGAGTRLNLVVLDAFFADYAHLFAWRVPDGGCIGFIRYRGAEGVEEFTRRLVEESGVLFLPSSLYRSELGPVPDNCLRVGFGRSHVPAGVAALRQWLEINGR